MPKYLYQIIDDNGNVKGEVELEHGMNEKLTNHPETGERLVRIYTSFGIGGAQKKSALDLGNLPEGCIISGVEQYNIPLAVIKNIQWDDGDVADGVLGVKVNVAEISSPIPGYRKGMDASLN